MKRSRFIFKSRVNLMGQCLYALALVVIYCAFFLRFYPNPQGGIGHDFAYFFPHLLDGYFWFSENGLLSVPWFSPAFCGGIPAWANPQNLFYSVPQMLTFVAGPYLSVLFTTALFVLLGYVGMYVLMASTFKTKPLVASFASTLFVLNGFYFSHLVVGHLSFHPFMLTPLLCYLLLTPHHDTNTLKNRSSLVFYALCAALIWAVMFYGGMLVLLPQTLAVVLAVACLYVFATANLKPFLFKFFLSGGIALGLCASRLMAVLSFMGQFPRSDYALPGSTLLEGAELFFRSLFLPAGLSFSETLISHAQWNPQPHEYDFSITPLPLLILGVGLFVTLVRKIPRLFEALTPLRWLCLTLLSLLLMFPFVLNLYAPGWHAFLKTLPLISSSSTMIRWFVIYMVVFLLASALVLERLLIFSKYSAVFCCAGMAVAIGLFLFQPASHLMDSDYEHDTINDAWRAHRSGLSRAHVSDVVLFTDEEGNHIITNADNDVIALNASQLYCDEPVFGYRLERFPVKTLSPGPVLSESGGFLNMKNPACYVYPEENACAPGDHFTVEQKDHLQRFASYRTFSFHKPLRQTLADWISLVMLGLSLVVPVIYACLSRMRK